MALPELTSTITFDGANPTTTIIERSTAGGTPPFMLLRMAVSTANQCWPTCTLTLKDVGLQNAVGFGGGVTNLAGRTVIDNSTIAGNTEGPTFRTTGRLTVKNQSYVTNNSSTGQGGVFSTEDEVTLTDTTFTSNMGGSGGVLHFGAASTVTATDSIFDFNSADAGGVFSGAGSLDVSDSTFTNNSATVGEGGAIGDVTGDIADHVNPSSTANSANASSGGAISSDAALIGHREHLPRTTWPPSMVERSLHRAPLRPIKNSTFSANGSNARGGGIALTVETRRSQTRPSHPTSQRGRRLLLGCKVVAPSR